MATNYKKYSSSLSRRYFVTPHTVPTGIRSIIARSSSDAAISTSEIKVASSKTPVGILLKCPRNDKKCSGLQYLTSSHFLYATALLPLSAIAASPSAEGVNTILNNILGASTILIQILITLAVLTFGWGIVKLIFAASDPKQVENAKGILLWGVIGIFVLSSLYGIITFIKTYVGLPDESPIQAPKFGK